ncbi:hypothetical protein EUX98_g7020 [Antrodiella citrinella]|uniref:BTB domain-containing protein n=1 Tax=Antrodiella citrinella TaxID=2447956 RepID=A0A4S4MMK4_9APHY|nr:hypothetical protein EUX98_g7020 [Antrodiella citrinella]
MSDSFCSSASVIDEPAPVIDDPFNASSPVADIVLRTSNDVDFTVIKAILSQASPFFHSMFTLPQPDQTTVAGKPVVSVAEDDRVLDTILRICYPIPNPPVDFDIPVHVLEAGKKYEISVVVEYALEGLKDLMERDPASAYTIACSFGLEDEALAAAQYSLRFSLPDILVQPTPFDRSNGLAVRSLAVYHMQCRDTSLLALRQVALAAAMYDCFWRTDHPNGNIRCRPWGPSDSDTTYGVAHAWFLGYMSGLTTVFREKPWGDVQWESKEEMLLAFLESDKVTCSTCRASARFDVTRFLASLCKSIDDAHRQCFRVFKAIISKASLFFHSMFTLPSGEIHDSDRSDRDDGVEKKPPEVMMAENSRTLELMLTFCYPMRTPSYLPDPAQHLIRIHDTLEIYQKFEIVRAQDFASAALLTLAESDPVECMEVTLTFVKAWPGRTMHAWRNPPYFWYCGSHHGKNAAGEGQDCPVHHYLEDTDTKVWRQAWWTDYMRGVLARMTTTLYDPDLVTLSDVFNSAAVKDITHFVASFDEEIQLVQDEVELDISHIV